MLFEITLYFVDRTFSLESFSAFILELQVLSIEYVLWASSFLSDWDSDILLKEEHLWVEAGEII